MAYRLDQAEPPFQGLMRTAHEQVASAVRVLGQAQDDAEAVHEARKCCKKARSALRLARPMLESVYDQENQAIGDAARMLSGLRDTQVLSQILKRQFADDQTAAKLRQQLLNGSSQEGAAGHDVAADVIQARDLLASVGERLTKVQPKEMRGSLRAGWRRTRRRACKALKQADRSRTPESFHDLRKRFKDLWYHARLLRDRAPKPMRRSIRDAATLTELLGDHHDLTVLDEMLRALESQPQDLQEAIRKKQRRLERQGVRAARRTLKRSPKAKALA